MSSSFFFTNSKWVVETREYVNEMPFTYCVCLKLFFSRSFTVSWGTRDSTNFTASGVSKSVKILTCENQSMVIPRVNFYELFVLLQLEGKKFWSFLFLSKRACMVSIETEEVNRTRDCAVCYWVGFTCCDASDLLWYFNLARRVLFFFIIRVDFSSKRVFIIHTPAIYLSIFW